MGEKRRKMPGKTTVKPETSRGDSKIQSSDPSSMLPSRLHHLDGSPCRLVHTAAMRYTVRCTSYLTFILHCTIITTSFWKLPWIPDGTWIATMARDQARHAPSLGTSSSDSSISINSAKSNQWYR